MTRLYNKNIVADFGNCVWMNAICSIEVFLVLHAIIFIISKLYTSENYFTF